MVECAVNHIEIAELDPPPRKTIVKRLRDRTVGVLLLSDNPDKRRSRRATLKCSSILYIRLISRNQILL